MICQICNKNAATVHITEIDAGSANGAQAPTLEQRHLCEPCAQKLKLPSLGASQKGAIDIWKLLQQSYQKAREDTGLTCPDCGMTLAEFRSKGRLGCPKDYEVFRTHLDPLLQRIHNASHHVGRIPQGDENTSRRLEALSELRVKLETAIREEAYEQAARLRDEIQALESSAPGASSSQV